jgi:Flp pilus assembly protein protease CpaA
MGTNWKGLNVIVDLSFSNRPFKMRDIAIPNSVNLALAGAFLLFAALFPLPHGENFTTHILFGMVMVAVGVIAFKSGAMGGGAAKFNAAVALWLGPSNEYAVFVMITCFLGAFLSVLTSRLLGRQDCRVPINFVGAPTFFLLFLTTPMWSTLRQFM